MQLKPIVEEYAISVAIHTAFFTADEYVRIMQAVDSPYIGLCLDTANAFLVLEDPLKFAAKVVPWVKNTHLKDSCIYLTDEGMHWLGGSPLGRGTVNLPAIIDLLWQTNPEVNLSIEDHWGRSTVPVFDVAFLESLPHWRGKAVADLLQHLHERGAVVQVGDQRSVRLVRGGDQLREEGLELRLRAGESDDAGAGLREGEGGGAADAAAGAADQRAPAVEAVGQVGVGHRG